MTGVLQRVTVDSQWMRERMWAASWQVDRQGSTGQVGCERTNNSYIGKEMVNRVLTLGCLETPHHRRTASCARGCAGASACCFRLPPKVPR